MRHVQTAPTIGHDLIGIVAAQSTGRGAQGLAFWHGFGPFTCVGRAGAGWLRAEIDINSASMVSCRYPDRSRSGGRCRSNASHLRDRNLQRSVGAGAAVFPGPGRRPCDAAMAVATKPFVAFMPCTEGIRLRGRTLIAPVAAAEEQIERAAAIADVVTNSWHSRPPRMKGKNERGCSTLSSVIPWSELSADRLQFGLGDRSIRLIRRNIRARNNGPVFIGAGAADDFDVDLQPHEAALKQAIDRIADSITALRSEEMLLGHDEVVQISHLGGVARLHNADPDPRRHPKQAVALLRNRLRNDLLQRAQSHVVCPFCIADPGIDRRIPAKATEARQVTLGADQRPGRPEKSGKRRTNR